jgi:hypothetical protein
MATHNWPRVRDELRRVPKGQAQIDEEHEAALAANRSRYDSELPRLLHRAPPPSRIPVGGGLLRKLRELRLIVRDSWRYLWKEHA